ncbi:asparagine synthase-related protein [Streptomyces sp. NPDC094034]|uniref:asparagine synthase-related protein n=1 Tax=Streptomyces sp. NPDC094034 TaxID=3155309 RepID=UPI00333274DD
MGFVILPDYSEGRRAVALLPGAARTRELTHASGRPWIVGHWDDKDIVLASAGKSRLALFGVTTATAARLAKRLGAVRTLYDLDTLVRSLPGCFHLIASVDGQVRAQGTVSNACQIFYGAVAGVTVAADGPRTLASMTGAGVDEELLALQLLAPFGPPWPLNSRSVWRGVRTLPPGSCLEMRQEGASVRTYWTPPDPEVPVAEGAAAIRTALENAVEARTARGGTISADLSGGKDSTSLCFLAARHDAPLVTVHLRSSDAANEDHAWATRCAAQLPGARHLTIPMSDTPGLYSESAMAADQDADAPLSFVRRPMMEHLARLVSGHGSTLHLQGMGSDELFLPSALSLHGLVRRHPLGAMRQVRAMKSMRRWSWATTARNLLHSESYPRWLRRAADGIAAERAWGTSIDWEVAPKMPPWATADAVDVARRMIRRAAEEHAEPLAALPVHHEMLRLTQVNGTAIRASSRIGARYGMSFQAPYVDDQVLTAAMSVRLADRLVPGQVKPVLAAAMRGIAPDDLLDRKSKGDASPELYIGLRRHRRRLLELFDDSRMARLGLVEPDGIRTVLRGLHADARPVMPFDPTLLTELWLRSVGTGPDVSATSTSSVPSAPVQGVS